MSHKVDLAEVVDLSDQVTKASSELGVGLETVINNIDTIKDMQSFTGKAAKSAKSYLEDFHVTVSNSFQVLFNDLQSNLRDHIDTFNSKVDSSAQAIIQTEYLEQIRQEIDLEYQKLTGFRRGVENTLDDISDIISISAPTLYDAMDHYKTIMKTIDELDKNINSFTKKGKGHNNTTKELIHNIEVAFRKAKAATNKDSIGKFEHGAANSGIMALKETVKWADRGKDVRDAIRADMTKNKIPTPNMETKNTKQTIREIAKNTGKSFKDGVKDGVKKVAAFTPGRRVLGPIGGGLGYYSNLNEAQAQGLKGKDAHIYAAEDTAIDIALGAATMAVAGGIVAAGAAALTGVAAVGAVAVTATVIFGWGLGKLLDIEFGKTKTSASGWVKKGFRKIKSWFS